MEKTNEDHPLRAIARKPKRWVAGAIKKPGAMTAAAKREGVSNSEYETEHQGDSGKAGERARLAITMKGWHKK